MQPRIDILRHGSHLTDPAQRASSTPCYALSRLRHAVALSECQLIVNLNALERPLMCTTKPLSWASLLSANHETRYKYVLLLSPV